DRLRDPERQLRQGAGRDRSAARRGFGQGDGSRRSLANRLIWKAEKIAGRARGRIAAVRGAITVPANRAPAIRRATARLLRELMTRNRLEPARIVSALFTSTPDLDADFPAHAARRMGWKNVPMLGALEVGVRGGLPRVIRVLLLVEGVRPG